VVLPRKNQENSVKGDEGGNEYAQTGLYHYSLSPLKKNYRAFLRENRRKSKKSQRREICKERTPNSTGKKTGVILTKKQPSKKVAMKEKWGKRIDAKRGKRNGGHNFRLFQKSNRKKEHASKRHSEKERP